MPPAAPVTRSHRRVACGIDLHERDARSVDVGRVALEDAAVDVSETSTNMPFIIIFIIAIACAASALSALPVAPLGPAAVQECLMCPAASES